MASKLSNEITVKINVSKNEFMDYLKENDFKETETFSLDDYYFIPKDLNLENLSIREILSKAIIIRIIYENNEVKKKLTFKLKNINELGEIISQKTIDCSVYDFDEAKNFLIAIGYVVIMNIKEDDIAYSNNDISIAVKFIKNRDILIEIETNDKYDTVEKLKEKITEINLPFDKNNYFIKKAEIVLSGILGRKE